MLLRAVPSDDPAIAWEGAIEVVDHDLAREALRLRRDALATADPGLVSRAWMPAGVRLRWMTDASTIELHSAVRASAEDWTLPPVDLVADGRVRTATPDARGVVAFEGLDRRMRIVEAWLPQFGRFPVTSVRLDARARIEAAPALGSPRLAVYGSSITQCRRASSPTRTWPAIAADAAGFDLTCLGFGGECQLDAEAAEAIVAARPDAVVVCAGINVYGAASMSSRVLRPALRAFLASVRRGCGPVPIVLCSPIASPARERARNAVGMTLADVRELVHEVGESMIAAGDARLRVVDGRSILGVDEEHLLADGLHPSAEGCERLGARWGEVLRTLETGRARSRPPRPS